MWKWIGLALILFELLYEWCEPFIKNKFGRTGAAISAVVLLYMRIRDRAQAKQVEERLKALEEGKPWNGDTTTLCKAEATSLRRLYLSSLEALSRVRRRRLSMKIDKAWMVAFFIFVGGLISKQLDIPLPEGYAEWAADTVMAISAIIMGYRNMTKKKEGEVAHVDSQSYSGHGPAV